MPPGTDVYSRSAGFFPSPKRKRGSGREATASEPRAHLSRRSPKGEAGSESAFWGRASLPQVSRRGDLHAFPGGRDARPPHVGLGGVLIG